MATSAAIVFALLSLSARRAWIEICGGVSARLLAAWSLSARRAWIEIPALLSNDQNAGVALRKESVDRNCRLGAYSADGSGRSPQGERG